MNTDRNKPASRPYRPRKAWTLGEATGHTGRPINGEMAHPSSISILGVCLLPPATPSTRSTRSISTSAIKKKPVLSSYFLPGVFLFLRRLAFSDEGGRAGPCCWAYVKSGPVAMMSTDIFEN